MHAVCELSWMKIWKRRRRVCWTKITIIYNLRNVYQTKDIQPWSESLKSVQVWVIEKSNNCALAHCSCKSTAGNFDRHVTDVVAVKIIFDKNSYHRSLKLVVWLPWHQFELDVWSWLLASFRVRDPKYLSVGFIFRISEVKDSSRLRFGSKYSTPSWSFRKYRIIGVSWRWFPRPRRLKNRPR